MKRHLLLFALLLLISGAMFGQEFTISVVAVPTEGGTPYIGNTPGITQATFNNGASCTVHANPNNGYIFVNWTVDDVEFSNEQNCTFPVDESLTLVAHFREAHTYTIRVSANPDDGGTVYIGETQGTIELDFYEGDTCTIHAVPAEGYAFQRWTVNNTPFASQANYTFIVMGNRDLVAQFVLSYTITVSADPTNGGTVSGGGTYNQGASCTVTATASNGFVFTNWTEEGNPNPVSTNANYTFTVNANRVLVANFEAQAPTEYTINVSANPTNGGTVTGGGTYQEGQQCTVTATASNGFVFTNWTEEGNPNPVSTNANYTFTVNANRDLVANFQAQPQTFTVTVSANPTNGGTVTGGGSYQQGQSCTVTATANSGFTFTNWTENGTEVSTNANYTFTVNANHVLVANFEAQAPTEYTITVSANPTNGGAPYIGNPPGTTQATFTSGQSCTVHANPNSGYTFVKWTVNGTQVSTQANYTFTVTSSRNLVAHFHSQQQTYTINAEPNPREGGTINGESSFTRSYTEGDTCTLVASHNAGYAFVKWMKNGVQVSTDPIYEFTVNSSQNFVAQFTERYTINASASPSNGGTVSGTGDYNNGESCTLTATASPGYTFQQWTENGTPVSTNANYMFTVTGNRTLVAQFQVQAPNTYNINVSANPSNGGTVNGGGSYTSGASCTVTATNNTGYTFLRWTENGSQVSTDQNYTFTVTNNRTLVAQFQVQHHTISVSASPTNGGNPYIGNTPGTTQATYNHNQSCTVHANPANGFNFVNWTVNGSQVSQNADYTFTVNSNRTLVAHFTEQAPNTYNITATADPEDGGTVTGSGSYEPNTTCTLKATPNTGYDFVKWTKNGQQVSTDATYSFTVTENASYVAHFQLKNFTISTSADPSDGGAVSGGGTYNYGQSCALSATPNSGYTFKEWTKDGIVVSSDLTYSFIVTGNANCVAHFTKDKCTIKVSANPTEGGTVSGGGTYDYGETCTVHASENEGYTFINWTENNQQVSTSADYEFTVTGDRTLVANFGSVEDCIIRVEIDPETEDCGTVTGSGAYRPGEECRLTAYPKLGYNFINWTKLGNVVSSNFTYTFTVTESEVYVAHFEKKKYSITVTAEPENGGSVTGGNNYFYGTACTLEARANTGYTFKHWMSDNTVVTTDNPYTFQVTKDASFIAFFEEDFIQQYTITATANPEEGGTVTGGGSYAYGVDCTLKARSKPGYTFTNWTENGIVVHDNATYTFTVTANRNLIANFEKEEVPCIDSDNIQKIVAKDHTENNETYTLILVYPNPDKEYKYQWLYATETDSLNYRKLNENDGTFNKQYFYKGGALPKGYYKVRISKEEDECSPVETKPYHVTYKPTSQLRIYPNPSRRGNNIVVMNDYDGPSQLFIYATDGRLLYTQTVTDSQTTINLNLPSGVYIAHLTDSDGYTKIGKLIIQ